MIFWVITGCTLLLALSFLAYLAWRRYRRRQARRRSVERPPWEKEIHPLPLQAPLQAFVFRRCQVVPGLHVPQETLYQAYKAWTEESLPHWTSHFSRRTFQILLVEAGFRKIRMTGGVYFWQGIALKKIEVKKS